MEIPTTFESARLLVVSRERSALGLLWALAEANAWELETVGSGWEALERVQTGTRSGIVVLDFAPGDSEGMYTLRWMRRVSPQLPVIVLSRSEDEEHRREALRLGASEYLTRPLDEQLLEAIIRRCFEESESLEAGRLPDTVNPFEDDSFFLALCPAMRKLQAQAELLAQVNAPLLIVGETGSGKELVARLIHKHSDRGAMRFLKVDCASLAVDSDGDDLFGREKSNGSYTGQLELCHKGTLFLDEITALSLSSQTRLLQILQEGHSSLRAEDGRNLDVRILAATRMNVEKAVGERKLREDLYYRLSAFTVHVPALRQRKEEIPVFLDHFMKRLAKRHGLPARSFSPAVLEACQTYAWPGNIHELEAFVSQYLIASDATPVPGSSNMDHGSQLRETVPLTPITGEGHAPIHSNDGETNANGLKSLLQNVRGETERNAIAAALEQTRWNRKAAAQLLRVSYRTLLYKIQQYHMTPPDSLYPCAPNNGLKNTSRGSQVLGSGAVRDNRS